MELLKKLKIKEHEPLWLINAPAHMVPLFPVADIKLRLTGTTLVSQLVVFAADKAALAGYMPLFEKHVGPDTLLWICYPKKSGSIQSDLAEDKQWDILTHAGYRTQTSVSIDSDWTGMRYTNAPVTKPSTYDLPPGLRQVEGVDFVNRTVQLPADAEKELSNHPGLPEFFNALAFTHKKEHAQAIADAKKPETRARRIEKMVEMLQQQMKAKARH